MLLVAFAVLTIIFGSLFAFEQIKSPTLTTVTSSTTLTTTLISTLTSNVTSTAYTCTYICPPSSITWTVTVTVRDVPNEGSIYFGGVGFFVYKRVLDMSAGTSVTFMNVTFNSMPVNITTSACAHYHVKVVFQDGATEQIGLRWCPLDSPQVRFTSHGNPRAGIIFMNPFYEKSFIAGGFYLLVSINETSL